LSAPRAGDASGAAYRAWRWRRSRELLTADANSPHRQAAPVGVGQAEAPSAELPTEQPILGYQVAEGVTLAALQPTDEHDEK
jgi:hypothetical protein